MKRLLISVFLFALIAGTGFVVHETLRVQALRKKLETVKTHTDVTAQISQNHVSSVAIPILSVDAEADLRNPDNPLSKIRWNISVQVLRESIQASESAMTGSQVFPLGLKCWCVTGNFIGNGEARVCNHTLYLRLIQDQKAGSISSGNISLMKIPGGLIPDGWIKTPLKETAQQELPQGFWEMLAMKYWPWAYQPVDKIIEKESWIHLVSEQTNAPIDGIQSRLCVFQISSEWITAQIKERWANDDLEYFSNLKFLWNLLAGQSPGSLGGAFSSLQCSDGELKLWLDKNDSTPVRATLVFDLTEGSDLPVTCHLKADIKQEYGVQTSIEPPQHATSLDKLLQRINSVSSLLQSMGGF